MARVRPLENTPVTMPSWPMVNDCSVPSAEPSCDRAATLDWPANWRSDVASPVAPKSTVMLLPPHAPVDCCTAGGTAGGTVGVSVRAGAGLKAGGLAVESQLRVALPTVTGDPPVLSGMVAVTVHVSAAVLAEVKGDATGRP